MEAAYKEIEERIENHLEHFDKMLERMRENYRTQLLQAKTDARVRTIIGTPVLYTLNSMGI